VPFGVPQRWPVCLSVATAAQGRRWRRQFPENMLSEQGNVFHRRPGPTGLASWAAHCDCAAWAANESGEVGQPGRKGRGGPGQASRLG
jgi:hypothetical protein